MVRKKTAELEKLAVQIFNETGSAYKVAKRLGVSNPTAYVWLRSAGVDLPEGVEGAKPLRHKVSAGEVAAIRADYEGGTRWTDLEAKYGHGQWAMREAMRRAGVDLKTRGGTIKKVSGEKEQEVVTAYQLGLSQQQVGELHKVGQSVISRLLRKNGVFRGSKASGDAHGNWKGGRVNTSAGYAAIFGGEFPEMVDTQGYTLEHRLVMARHLGRSLTKHETVHHINGNRQDNRIENLQLRQGKHGAGSVFRCKCCGSYDIESTKIAEDD